MKTDIFTAGDTVLLLGEGNFSFARSLYCLNLPITITATCLDNGVKYKEQLENINFLLENNVPIYLDVDATKLHQHPVLKTKIFSKIIFNFPHVGGKMKIQLNRNLIQKVFESSSKILNNGDMLIMSLCNGQGGTPADNPQRKWDDSWQITEMAAYGDFSLFTVEPFDFRNFPLYSCTGYRSQDTHFNLEGALVHIFRKNMKPSRIVDDKTALKKLSLMPLYEKSEVFVPYHYSKLYCSNPLNNSDSAMSFIKKLLMNSAEKYCLPNLILEVGNKDVSLTMDSRVGVPCQVNSSTMRLRFSAVQVINELVTFLVSDSSKEVLFYPGIFFNPLGEDFENTAPITFQFILIGMNVSNCFNEFVRGLISLFNRNKAILQKNTSFFKGTGTSDKKIWGLKDIYEIINVEHHSDFQLTAEWTFSDDDSIEKNIVAHEFMVQFTNLKLEAFVIYADTIVDTLFCTHSWKERWSDDNHVSLVPKSQPIIKHGLLYPLSYTFDITLKYDSNGTLAENDVYNVLRISAIDLIKEVKLINEYDSGSGWSSKCFRITYQSWNEPLNRDKALIIHNKVVGKMLTLSLPVVIK